MFFVIVVAVVVVVVVAAAAVCGFFLSIAYMRIWIFIAKKDWYIGRKAGVFKFFWFQRTFSKSTVFVTD